MKNINLLLPNPLLIYHEKFSPRIAAGKGTTFIIRLPLERGEGKP